MQLSTTSPYISYGGCLLPPIFCAPRSATNPNVGPSHVGWRPSIDVLSHALASLFLTSSQLSKPYRLSLQSILLPEEDSEARKGVRRVSPDLDVTEVASAVSSSLPLGSHTVRHLLIPCTRKRCPVPAIPILRKFATRTCREILSRFRTLQPTPRTKPRGYTC
jgi:hypothetical protein